MIFITDLPSDPRPYFFTVAKGIGVKWTQLSGKLDRRIDTDVIAEEKTKVYDRAMAVLNKWYSKEASKATTARLLQALRDIEKTDVIEDIYK